jgi:antitoxin PrlF
MPVEHKSKSSKRTVSKRPIAEHPSYAGKRTKTGNSTGFRFESALFKSHPEFSGDVRAHVIAPGRLLVTAEPLAESTDDPVLASFLAFLDEDMLKHPERILPLAEERSRRIKELVEGVVVDDNEDFGDEILF